jgi:hypothetical protein
MPHTQHCITPTNTHTHTYQVRLLAAEAALAAGEGSIAAHLALQLASARYTPAWRLAAELACPHRCVCRQHVCAQHQAVSVVEACCRTGSVVCEPGLRRTNAGSWVCSLMQVR